jgi:Mg-chelatase subunit ChlD
MQQFVDSRAMRMLAFVVETGANSCCHDQLGAHSMRHYMPLSAFVLLGAAALLAGACTEDQRETIAATAQQVRAGTGTKGQIYLGVDLLVTDEQNQSVRCGQGNVRVTFETSRNGNEGPWVVADEQDIKLACNDGRGDLAMVVDNSGSVSGQLTLLKQGVAAVAQRLIDSGGRMSLVRVSTDATVLSPLTNTQNEIDAAISGLTIRNGWTALWDGVRIANETLGAATSAAARDTQPNVAAFCSTARKQAIVVFTDGKENNSSNQRFWSTDYPGDGLDTKLTDLESLRVAGVTTPIYAIGLGKKVDTAALESLTKASGGRYIAIDDVEQIPGVLAMMSEYFAATHRVCTELPSHQCGPLDVRVTYHYSVNGLETSAVKLEHLNVPCDIRAAGRVATILLTLVESETDQDTLDTLVANTVNYVSPSDSPRVLFVRDDFHHGEYDGDTAGLHQRLVDAGYAADFLDEPADGLKSAALADYDVVWFSNPGYPIDDEATVLALRQFSADGGGVVLQGDDMSWAYGNAFSMSDLTRLAPIDNGVTYCGQAIDNGRGGRYRVTLETLAHPMLRGIEDATFLYGDDIDTASVLEPTTTVLAWATADGVKTCSRKPVITVFTPPPAQ